MESLLPVIPALPLLGSITIGLIGRRVSREVAGWIGTGAMFLAAFLSFRVLFDLIGSAPGTVVETTDSNLSTAGTPPMLSTKFLTASRASAEGLRRALTPSTSSHFP